MKKVTLIFSFIVAITLTAIAQRTTPLTVATKATLFGVNLSSGEWVFETDSSQLYVLTAAYVSTDNMDDVFTDGNYEILADYSSAIIESDTVNTPIFTTDIANGTGTRVLVIPAGYWVEAIKVVDAGTAGGLSAIIATQETSAVTLITGKSVATGTTILFKTLTDHNVYAANKNLTFTATGNGGTGMAIIVYLRK